MTTENIHGYKVEYDEKNEIIKTYLDHLEHSLSHEEFNAIYDDAERNEFRKKHLEDKHGNEFTLVYKGGHSCLLRKREI